MRVTLETADTEAAAAAVESVAEDVVAIPGRLVRARLTVPPDRGAVLDALAAVPFEVATLPSHADVWRAEYGYRPPGFDRGHPPHGWACAFRAAGHERLVSRRWLEHGPWTLVRGPDDLTFVEFHSPRADAGAALDRARRAHVRMGISDTGGYLQAPPVDSSRRYLYDRETRTLRAVVTGRDVGQREMLEACHARREPHVDAVRFVFTEPERALAHLAELWLRELECWTTAVGVEQRLDGPAPPKALASTPQ